MIQLVINTVLLRELEEEKLIHEYAKHMYSSKEDVEEDSVIKNNLQQLLDWDINGDNGLALYCGKFESIKRKDWELLISKIKENKSLIENLAKSPLKEFQLKQEKVIKDHFEKKELHNIERFTDKNYTVSGRGKRAKPCEYNGKIYSSRQECRYKEGITQNQLYRYLERTNQI